MKFEVYTSVNRMSGESTTVGRSIFAFVDVDGFNLGGNLVPRELGIATAWTGCESADIDVRGVYFDGGLAPEYVAANAATIAHVQRKIHGMPLVFADSAAVGGRLVRLESATWVQEFAKYVAAMTDKHGEHGMYIFHKGGLEGRELAAGGFGNVIDLNDFSCPKSERLPKTDVKLCSRTVHSLLSRSRDWRDHCPQHEVYRLAVWALENLSVGVDGGVTRTATISEEELARTFAAIMLADNAPKTPKAAGNFVRQKLLKMEKYATADMVDRLALSNFAE